MLIVSNIVLVLRKFVCKGAAAIKGGFLAKIYLVGENTCFSHSHLTATNKLELLVCLCIFHMIEQVKIWSTEDITTHETGDIACRDLLMNWILGTCGKIHFRRTV